MYLVHVRLSNHAHAMNESEITHHHSRTRSSKSRCWHPALKRSWKARGSGGGRHSHLYEWAWRAKIEPHMSKVEQTGDHSNKQPSPKTSPCTRQQAGAVCAQQHMYQMSTPFTPSRYRSLRFLCQHSNHNGHESRPFPHPRHVTPRLVARRFRFLQKSHSASWSHLRQELALEQAGHSQGRWWRWKAHLGR